MHTILTTLPLMETNARHLPETIWHTPKSRGRSLARAAAYDHCNTLPKQEIAVGLTQRFFKLYSIAQVLGELDDLGKRTENGIWEMKRRCHLFESIKKRTK